MRKLFFAAVALILCTAAFLRGNYLLGADAGIVYVAITLALSWLWIRLRTPGKKPTFLRVGFVSALSLALAIAMAFPASVDSDFKVFINQQATDRAARAELAALFATESAFSNLSVSTKHTKSVIVSIRGSLGTHVEFDRLRAGIIENCPTIRRNCLLEWNVRIHDAGEQINLLDYDLNRGMP